MRECAFCHGHHATSEGQGSLNKSGASMACQMVQLKKTQWKIPSSIKSTFKRNPTSTAQITNFFSRTNMTTNDPPKKKNPKANVNLAT